MVKKIIYVVCAFCVILGLLSYLYTYKKNTAENNKFIYNEDNKKSTQEKDKNIPKIKNELDGEVILTRAMLCKMLSLLFYDDTEIGAMDREIEYEDCSSDDWYDKYINAAITGQIIEVEGSKFEPNKVMTNNDVYEIFNGLSDIYNVRDIDNLKEKGNEKISAKDFINYYIDFIKNNNDLDTGITTQQLIIIGTPMNSEQLDSWQMATDKGIYNFYGLALDKCIDKKVNYLIKDNVVLAKLSEVEQTPVLKNAYITSKQNDSITIYMGGIHRKYIIENNLNNAIQVNEIADVIIDNGRITNINPKKNYLTGKIMRVGNNYIELDSGYYMTDNEIKIYSNINGDIRWSSLSQLLVGSEKTEFVLYNNQICAAIIKGTTKFDKIRVAIRTTGLDELVHKSVILTSDTDYEISNGEEKKTYKALEEFKVDNLFNNEVNNNRIYIKPVNEDGKIIIKSITRAQGYEDKYPMYRGVIEVAEQDTGYSIVNEVGIEDYLCCVVPSEMPSSYGVEPSKVQAITARSYAYNQINANRYHNYGAHVDDSTYCQVYNNYMENDVSRQAVEETKGLGIKYNGSVVNANYFSTSCGYTANSGEVWLNYLTHKFPTTTPKYLTAKPQYEDKLTVDLTDENNFYDFIKNGPKDAYDKNVGWYRWETSMTREQIEASINENISNVYKQSPKLVKTLDIHNFFRSRKIDTIGQLEDLYVYKRGDGGNIMEMVIVGTEKTVKIMTENLIRKVIRPKNYINGEEEVVIKRSDDKQYPMSTMPSAFYTLEKVKSKEGELLSVNFLGGGYGHGVGMSQNGVKGMADKGYDFKQILQHYYEGIKIEPIF